MSTDATVPYEHDLNFIDPALLNLNSKESSQPNWLECRLPAYETTQTWSPTHELLRCTPEDVHLHFQESQPTFAADLDNRLEISNFKEWLVGGTVDADLQPWTVAAVSGVSASWSNAMVW
jgi:hypothetical protein